MLTALDHVIVAVADLAAASASYTRLLGRRPSWHGTHPAWGTANTLYRLSNTYLELVSPVGDGPFADLLRQRLTHGEGPYGLAFGTDDADHAVAALRARGLEAAPPRDGSGRNAAGAERRWRNVFLATADTRGVPLLVIEHRSPPEALPPAAPLGEAAAAIDGLDHAVVMTADAEAAIGLYRDRLGLRLAFDKTFDARGVRLLFFRIAGITVELAAPLGADDPAAPDRFWGLSYRVQDIDAARARLAAAGVDVSEVRDGNKAGTRVCSVRSHTHGVATILIWHPPR
ncbi:MAG: VOC family protein [Deltaproteobacteria bacterium]|nr:VOC family protein [Deltaproteobacteria bacterium]